MELGQIIVTTERLIWWNTVDQLGWQGGNILLTQMVRGSDPGLDTGYSDRVFVNYVSYWANDRIVLVP